MRSNDIVLIDRESIEFRVGYALSDEKWEAIHDSILSEDKLWNAIYEVVGDTLTEMGIESNCAGCGEPYAGSGLCLACRCSDTCGCTDEERGIK